MGTDEQKEEREVLDSIFPDEITGLYCSKASVIPPDTRHIFPTPPIEYPSRSIFPSPRKKMSSLQFY